jgi:hypothetical protein
MDYLPVVFRFEYTGALQREFIGSIVTREARPARCNASYPTVKSARYKNFTSDKSPDAIR